MEEEINGIDLKHQAMIISSWPSMLEIKNVSLALINLFKILIFITKIFMVMAKKIQIVWKVITCKGPFYSSLPSDIFP